MFQVICNLFVSKAESLVASFIIRINREFTNFVQPGIWYLSPTVQVKELNECLMLVYCIIFFFANVSPTPTS